MQQTRENNFFILYDAPALDVTGAFQDMPGDVFFADGKYAFCKGCFDCWLKTPGSCIMRDKVYGLANHLADCSDFVIVSRLLYGGFSIPVKAVVDRLIAFNLPYFRMLDGELHHKPRYDNCFKLRIFFYGEATERERETARAYIARIALNFNSEDYRIEFLGSEPEGRDVYENLVRGL